MLSLHCQSVSEKKLLESWWNRFQLQQEAAVVKCSWFSEIKGPTCLKVVKLTVLSNDGAPPTHLARCDALFASGCGRVYPLIVSIDID